MCLRLCVLVLTLNEKVTKRFLSMSDCSGNRRRERFLSSPLIRDYLGGLLYFVARIYMSHRKYKWIEAKIFFFSLPYLPLSLSCPLFSLSFHSHPFHSIPFQLVLIFATCASAESLNQPSRASVRFLTTQISSRTPKLISSEEMICMSRFTGIAANLLPLWLPCSQPGFSDRPDHHIIASSRINLKSLMLLR